MGYKKIDGYEVDTDQHLGKGHFAHVFLGRKSRTKEPIAAKQIWVDEEDPEEVKDVMKEVKTLEKIPPHPNIVNFQGTEMKDNYLWIFQDYCNSGDLNKYAKKNNNNCNNECNNHEYQTI